MGYLREKLKVSQIKRKTTNYYFGERLKKLTIEASNKEYDIKIECEVAQLGTYKDDNVIKLSELMNADTVFDLVEGEQGYGVNLNRKNKAYYSPDCYHLPYYTKVEERKRKDGGAK